MDNIKDDFLKELTNLVNKYSKENGSDTPDYVLAEYLNNCLEAFNLTLKARKKFYGEFVGKQNGKEKTKLGKRV